MTRFVSAMCALVLLFFWQSTSSISVNHGVKIPFYEALTTLSSISHRFMFPGHFGGSHASPEMLSMVGLNTLRHDLPELEELGNIHSPNAALQEALTLAAAFYKCYQTYFLINGSTGGILSAMMALKEICESSSAGKSDRKYSFIITRDAHKSVFDGLALSHCGGIVLPCQENEKFGISYGFDVDVLLKTIDECIAQKEPLCGVILTRPSYQGIGLHGQLFTDLISECHKRNVPVLVDEAHGSHWALLQQCLQDDGYFDALHCGADVVIQSSHKTLGALSQAAMMHLGNNIQNTFTGYSPHEVSNVFQKYYSMLSSTSANALLLASLDCSRAHMESCGVKLTQSSLRAVSELMQEKIGIEFLNNDFVHSSVPREYVVDPLRLSAHFPAAPNDADMIDEYLAEETDVYCELNLQRCVTYNIPIGATRDTLSGLEKAFQMVESLDIKSIMSHDNENCGRNEEHGENLESLEVAYIDLSAASSSIDTITWQEGKMDSLIDRVCAENIMLYPPGIPILMKGERLLEKHVQELEMLRKGVGLSSGRTIVSSDPTLNTIQVFQKIN